MKCYLFALVLVFVLVFNSLHIKANEYYSLQDSTLKKSTSNTSLQDSTKKKKPTTKPFPKSKLGVDIMTLMTGEEKEVEIRKFSTKYIYYSNPRESSMKQVDRRLVNIIYYRSGRKEVITPKVVDIPKNSDWEKIKVTEDPKEVSPLMVEIDVIEVVVEASGREQYYKPQTLENSAFIVLKKKAALLNAELVLIKKKSHSRPYGEAPSLKVEAIAYRKI
jgi:hypothetical protein